MSGAFSYYFWLSVLLSNLNEQQMYRTALQSKGLLGLNSFNILSYTSKHSIVQRLKTYVQ